jgi:glycosyltransferase involved in cell wall biosynthesis
MNILLVEPTPSGHHFALYTRLIIHELVENNFTISLLTTKRAIHHPSYELLLKASKNNLDVNFMNDSNLFTSKNNKIILLIDQFLKYFNIKRAFNEIISKKKIHKILFLDIDYCDKAISILGSPFGNHIFNAISVTILFHRNFLGISNKNIFDNFYKLLFIRTLRLKTLKQLFVIDESFINYIENKTDYNKVLYLPDPVEINGTKSKLEVRKEYTITEDKFVILVYGSIDSKKGLLNLLNGLLYNNIKNVVILVAGKIEELLFKMIQGEEYDIFRNNSQLIIFNKFINIDEEYNIIKISDLIWLGYLNSFSGSSGVFYQAALNGIPVISKDTGVLNWMTRKNMNGICCNPNSPKSVNESILKIYENKNLRDSLGNNGYNLTQLHDSIFFKKIIIENI